MSIHHDLSMIEKIALHKANEHNCVYHIILMNPDEQGNFDLENGSTYEFVRESFFEDESNLDNIKYLAICDTEDLKNRHIKP